MKIYHKKELQNIAINHSSDLDCNDFMKIYGKRTSKPFSFLTLPASDSLRFRKNLLNAIPSTSL